MVNGIINIYKESGYTSHDVVAKMRGIFKQKKIGHTGTLDPDAKGVLPVCLGSATKLCDLLTGQDKEYEAQMLLGITTDTQDMSGSVLDKKEVCVTKEEVRMAAESFIGGYGQIPPMYSAIKVNGKKLYELARAGREVERKPRQIQIYEIEIKDVQLPYVSMRVLCSKGTYIRTLCHDIGKKLGCGAAMAKLTRTKAGRFRIEEACSLLEVEKLWKENALGSRILPPDAVLDGFAALTVRKKSVPLIQNGNPFYPAQILGGAKTAWQDGETVRVYDAAHKFYGLYGYQAATGSFKAVKMFLEQEGER